MFSFCIFLDFDGYAVTNVTIKLPGFPWNTAYYQDTSPEYLDLKQRVDDAVSIRQILLYPVVFLLLVLHYFSFSLLWFVSKAIFTFLKNLDFFLGK